MGQERLESLMFSAIENDLTNALNLDNLVAAFAAKAERRMNLE